jgi:FKBP-type peptidyl-prolyl cis-trans isomerase FklB
MKKHLIALLCISLAAGAAVAAETAVKPAVKKAAPKAAKKTEAPAAKKVQLTTKKDRVSYAVGYNNGYGLKHNLEAQSIEFDAEIIKRGFMDALASATPSLSEQDIRAVLGELQKDLEAKRQETMAKQQEKMKVEGEKNKINGDAFLKENSKKEGVKVLPSGLQYKMLVEGKGKQPTATDSVTVNYKGTLIDGTEFDSSYKRGQAATFQLNQVIKGWTEGIQLMKEGGKMQLFIPAELGYGERGGGQIGPNSTLIFDVELISVQPAAAVKSEKTGTAK